MSDERSAADPAVQLVEAVRAVSRRRNADVILFNQNVTADAASALHEQIDSLSQPQEAVFLILVTNGGDAHAAYIIGRELQSRYKKVIVCIAGDCYSAGTLIACCADEIVITPRGRLGPLDVQILKKDELYESVSGLTASNALDELGNKAFQTLAWIASELKGTFGWQLSFKTALDVAASMTAQMYGEVYRQIDPIRLAEDARALRVAAHYASILNKTSRNLRPARSVD